jgi:pimeloyl-ACP methyl ester carboxylesterase
MSDHRKRMKNFGFRILRAAGIAYLLVCLGCAAFQRRLIYFPPIFTSQKADEIGRTQGLERWTDSSGKQIGWKRISPVRPATGKVLITHGNACAAVQCGHYADVLQQAAALDVFIVEYPGYADRPGSPSERTLNESSEEAFQLLVKKNTLVSTKGEGRRGGTTETSVPVYLVGESLGTGVAAYLAGRHPESVAGVALLAPYNRLADVAQYHMPIIPVRLLLRDRFPAEDHLRNYHGPIAMLLAGADRVVPEKFGRKLYDHYDGPKKVWSFPEGDHGTVMLQPSPVWKEIAAFWQSDYRGNVD